MEGSGTKVFEALHMGEEADFQMLAIRRRLVDVAKKRMTSVMQVTNN